MIIKWGSVKALGLALAMGGAAIVGTAQAADYDPPVFEETEITEVEFGTGWYIRGDLGMGVQEIEDSQIGNLGYPVNLTAGIGYMMGDSIRIEAAANFIQNLSAEGQNGVGCGVEDDGTAITGTCYTVNQADPWAANFMGNIYYDFPAFFGVRPYVGAGAGIGFYRRGDLTTETFCVGVVDTDCGAGGGAGESRIDQSTSSANGKFVASGNVMAGVSYAMTENTSLDLGLRYTYLGGSRGYDNAGETDAWGIGEAKIGMRVQLW